MFIIAYCLLETKDFIPTTSFDCLSSFRTGNHVSFIYSSHRAARKFKLKTKSFGEGQNRFLVLSRKFSALELIEKIMQEGGTSKYEVVPPRR